jgi:uncharacterized protein YjaG (DUF416 family)
MASTTEIKSRLEALAPRKRLAFACSVCERMVPNYETFATIENWGEPAVLRRALDSAWALAEGSDVPDVDDLIEELDGASPDTEDFDSLFTSPALDAASALTVTLEAATDSMDGLGEIVDLATDTVDLFLHNTGRVHAQDADRELQIAQHPLMRRELEQQQRALDALERCPELDASFLRKLRAQAATGGLPPDSA